jgi:hypothetical protein
MGTHPEFTHWTYSKHVATVQWKGPSTFRVQWKGPSRFGVQWCPSTVWSAIEGSEHGFECNVRVRAWLRVQGTNLSLEGSEHSDPGKGPRPVSSTTEGSEQGFQ